MVKFTLSGEAHQLKLMELTNKTATFNLSSAPEVFTLAVGEEKKKDFDNNGAVDLSIALNSIRSGKAEITIKAFLPAAKTAEEAEKPETAGEAKKEAKEPPPQEEEGSIQNILATVTSGGVVSMAFIAGLVVLIASGAYLGWSRMKKKK